MNLKRPWQFFRITLLTYNRRINLSPLKIHKTIYIKLNKFFVLLTCFACLYACVISVNPSSAGSADVRLHEL